VGMYSLGKAFVVYEMSMHVYSSFVSARRPPFWDSGRSNIVLTLPTAPSPVTTHYQSGSRWLALVALRNDIETGNQP
jgi:hypothetical protein